MQSGSSTHYTKRAHTNAHTHAHTYIHTHIHTCTHMHTYIHTRAHAQTQLGRGEKGGGVFEAGIAVRG